MIRPLVAFAVLALAVPVHGQTQTMRVVGSAQIEVAPDYADLTFGVRVSAPSPADAADEMTRRIDLIVDSLVVLGFDRDSLPTKAFSISTDRDYQNRNEITGYTAVTSLQLTTFELDRIPEFIAAAIALGANEIGNVRFRSTLEDEVRQVALREAVAAARSDAEVLADAAGATLGDLVEITNFAQQISALRTGIVAQRREIGADLEIRGVTSISGSVITPQLIPVSVQVVVTWSLRGGGAPD